MASGTQNDAVVMGTTFVAASRVRWRNSLWLRLTALITLVMTLVLGVVLWMTGRVLERAAVRTGSERALTAASQAAAAIGQQTARGLIELQRLNADPVLRQFVESPTPELGERVLQRLRPLATPGQPPAYVLSRTGEILLEIDNRGTRDVDLPPPQGVPASIGISPMQSFGADKLFADVVIELRSSGDDAGDGTQQIGFFVIRRLLSPGAGQNADIIRRLVGTGATAAMGNREGSTPWTNFNGLIPPPPSDITRNGSSVYTAADGAVHVAAIATAEGTPWAIWIDFPQAMALAPMQTVLRGLTLFAAGTAFVGVVVSSWLLARAVKPLNELTAASEAMAGGSYDQRVSADRADEIGRLGATFNTMADRVAQSRQELEQRVEERTSSLREAREELEEQLASSTKIRAELDQFFALSPDMLCIADTEGRFLRVNEAWEDALGWRPDELTGQHYIHFVHPDDVPSTMTQTSLQATGMATRAFENRYRCRDGSYRWLSWRAAPVEGTQLVYAAARDVTERRRVARELEQRAAELADVNQELEAFSYSVSHDLRAPLRHIQGFVGFLDKSVSDRLDPREQRWLATIRESASRMSNLIDDLLAFSRMNRTALEAKEIALADVVRDARRELAPDPQAERVAWTIMPLPTVHADAALLQMVFVNLLSNALKYTRLQEQPRITIGTVPGDGDEVIVFVRDNGVGFDMQYAHKLFGVFQRLHADVQFEGTGIGLANVRRIIQRHGGRTWAEGVLNEGATFYFSLPQRRS